MAKSNIVVAFHLEKFHYTNGVTQSFEMKPSFALSRPGREFFFSHLIISDFFAKLSTKTAS